MPETQIALGEDRVLAATIGDITRVTADAIVNAANEWLGGGGGVDGAIHRAGGPAVMADLEARYGRTRRCPTGSAVLSAAGDLPARWVVHAVGPIWRGGGAGEPALLDSAYRTALRVADEAGARTIAFPAISAGIYGYPLEDAARVGVRAVRESLVEAVTLRKATFVLFSERAFAAFDAALRELSPGS